MWVAFLQNIHLVAKWLPKLEKQLEQYSTGSHESYRVFMSAEPAPTPESHIIPQVGTCISSLRTYVWLFFGVFQIIKTRFALPRSCNTRMITYMILALSWYFLCKRGFCIQLIIFKASVGIGIVIISRHFLFVFFFFYPGYIGIIS